MVEKSVSTLRFNGSVWCNLDVALRNVDQIFRRAIRPLELTVIEWYILRALYDQDGQHASELARAVGRAATSFTPNLDKLQEKGYIERRSDPGDRRAVRIFLTDSAQACREQVQEMSDQVDAQILAAFPEADYQTFLEVLAALQTMLPE
ncbi:MAG: MarR family winged helix-turn-helix transcriptional regulator [Anaerolineae bacterium]|jgi:DNA-binding MarR family transcriptional regulator|nr:MarR family winged helix-turn-helix transcriptional regulator [Anaerolineae bacterium]